MERSKVRQSGRLSVSYRSTAAMALHAARRSAANGGSVTRVEIRRRRLVADLFAETTQLR